MPRYKKDCYQVVMPGTGGSSEPSMTGFSGFIVFMLDRSTEYKCGRSQR
jgi:hypothetical protein